MNLVEKLCKELGVEVGEEWRNVDGGTFKIEKDGLFYKDLTNKCWSKPLYSDMYESLLTGELKPIWKPKHGDSYFIPTLSGEDKYTGLIWMDMERDIKNLNKNMIFRTKEEAISMTEKILDFIKEER